MSIIERAVRRLKTVDVAQAPRATEIIEERRPALLISSTPPTSSLPPISSRPRTSARRSARSDAESTPRSVPLPKRVTPIDTASVAIDLDRLERAGMIVPDGRRTQISEEFRVIKRKLLQNAKQGSSGPSGNNNLILVTSAFPDEGKTFSSINLALSLSLELDHSVLLVDADVAQAGRSDFLGLRPGKGLMDLLLDKELSLEQTIIRTNVERLNVLLAGQSHHQANELLASESMGRLLDQLTAQAPGLIVILDGPPLLVTTEAGTLAHRAGQVVLVVAADETPQTALKAAMAHLEGCRVFGLLNKSTRSLGRDVFDYGRYRYSE